jgi:hypothetical protein
MSVLYQITVNKPSVKRPQDQTNEEWLHDYVTSPAADGTRLIDREPKYPWETKITSPLEDKPQAISPSGPSTDTQDVTQDAESTLIGDFHYIEHWTFRKARKTGGLSLTFAHNETGVTASMFFNVDLRNYQHGKHGQFLPPVLGKFVKFWTKFLGNPPRQWSRAHHGLRNLKGMRLSGTAILKHKESGEEYWELIELKKIGLLDVSSSA